MKTNDILEAFEKFTATGDKSNGLLIVDDQGGDTYHIRTTNSSYRDLVALLVNTMSVLIKRADDRQNTITILADMFTAAGLKNNDEDVKEFLYVLDTIQQSAETPTIQ